MVAGADSLRVGRRAWWQVAWIGALVAALCAASPPSARGSEAGLEARIADVATTPGGDVVTGRIDNATAGELRDVRVLVTHSFLWADEKNPGEDNPGRSEVFVVSGPIPPHGSAHFRHEVSPPLPPRSDGRYSTTAKILGVTTVGP